MIVHSWILILFSLWYTCFWWAVICTAETIEGLQQTELGSWVQNICKWWHHTVQSAEGGWNGRLCVSWFSKWVSEALSISACWVVLEKVLNWWRNLLNLKHDSSLRLNGCSENGSNFVGMGGRAFYPEDKDGSLLQNVDKQNLTFMWPCIITNFL